MCFTVILWCQMSQIHLIFRHKQYNKVSDPIYSFNHKLYLIEVSHKHFIRLIFLTERLAVHVWVWQRGMIKFWITSKVGKCSYMRSRINTKCFLLIHEMSLQSVISYIITYSWSCLLNAVLNCTLHAFLVYFPHVLFSLFVILQYHCIN